MTTPTVDELVENWFRMYKGEDRTYTWSYLEEILRNTYESYGNKRYEEGAKAESERVREWASKNTEWYYKGMMRAKVSCEYNECLEDLTEFLSENK